MIISETQTSRARPHEGVDGLYIVENSALETLLFDRNALGASFQQRCRHASLEMLRHVEPLLGDDAAELVLLSKGLVYQLGAALAESAGRVLPLNLVAARRAAIQSESAIIETPYVRCDTRASTVVIGDTVASGSTVIAALEAYGDFVSIERVVVLSFAGALIGARRVREHCDRAGIELTMLFGLAAFGLGSNGFDLSFLDPGTITADRYRDRSAAQFAGRPVSAVGWDFGSQVTAPIKYRHLCWLEAEMWGLHGHPSLACELRPDDLEAFARKTPEVGAFSPATSTST